MNYKNRLISLDVLRGLTVAMMILVNNGVGHDQFSQLMHSKWNGLTVCDLVFPFFLFMVGVSIAISMSKYGPDARAQHALEKGGWNSDNPTEANSSRRPIIRKVLIRTVKMFLIGVLLHAWDMWIWGEEDILANLRIWGVLERIALCYCAASFVVLFVKARYIGYIIVSLIIAYAAILKLGNGYAQDETNIACIVDRAIFGVAHLYHKSPVDPEGLLGTIPAIAHTLIGVTIGRFIRQKGELKTRLKFISLFGAVLIVIGILFSFGMPLNKRIWSPSYALVTCGIASLLLALLTYLIDMLGKKKSPLQLPQGGEKTDGKKTELLDRRDGTPRFAWYRPFQWFGMNAIILYVASEALAPIMGIIDAPHTVYDSLMGIGFTAEWASLCYSLSFVLLMTVLAAILYWRKIFIKL